MKLAPRCLVYALGICLLPMKKNSCKNLRYEKVYKFSKIVTTSMFLSVEFDFVFELFFRHAVSTHDTLIYTSIFNDQIYRDLLENSLLSIPLKESTILKIYHKARSISFTNEIKLICHTR